MVAGHVDCVGQVVEKRTTGVGFLMGFLVDSGRYLIEKGSVAVDGVSLTVNRVARSALLGHDHPVYCAVDGVDRKKDQ